MSDINVLYYLACLLPYYTNKSDQGMLISYQSWNTPTILDGSPSSSCWDEAT